MHNKVSIKQITLIDHTQTLQREFAALNRTKNLGMMMKHDYNISQTFP